MQTTETKDITVHIHQLHKEYVFEQCFDLDEADQVQGILDWYRSGRDRTLTIETANGIHTFQRRYITSIDVYGYKEIINSKWYQRLMDQYRVWRMLRK